MQITNYKFAKLRGLGTKFKLNIHKYTVFQMYCSQMSDIFSRLKIFDVYEKQRNEIFSGDKS